MLLQDFLIPQIQLVESARGLFRTQMIATVVKKSTPVTPTGEPINHGTTIWIKQNGRKKRKQKIMERNYNN